MARRKRPKTSKPEFLMRQIAISAVAGGASVRAVGEKGTEPRYDSSARLELNGTLAEAVRKAHQVEIVLYAKDDVTVGREPVPWVGTIDLEVEKIRPVLFVSHQDFNRIWALALAGLLKHAHMVFTKPHYRTAFVQYLSFSTHEEE